MFCNVQETDVDPLSRWTKAVGMIILFQPDHSVVENGIFGLPKTLETNSPQGLIMDGRRSTLCFNHKLAPVVLPYPDMVGDVYLASPDPLFLSASYLSQMYNRHRPLAWLWRYLGPPRACRQSFNPSLRAYYYLPVLKVVPLGWSVAVGLVQAVLLKILRRAGVPE